MSHIETYLYETAEIASKLDTKIITQMVDELVSLRERKGRLFIIGLGGSAANASHMCNDLRKLCGVEAYALTDNVAELTARANDEGFPFIFDDAFWKPDDALFVLSVGGGTRSVSQPLVQAINDAGAKGMTILGIVGRDGGRTKEYGDCVMVVPTVSPERVTPHTEAFQAVIWHCLVSHPDLQQKATKW